MSDRSTTTSKSFSDSLIEFLGNHRKALLVIAGVIVVGIVAAVVVAQIANVRSDRAVRAAEHIQSLWSDYQDAAGATDQVDQAASLEEELRTAITDAKDQYPRTYGALRAQFVLGQLEWSLENWQAAQDAFMAVVNDHRTTHLTAPAMFSAAAAAENLGELDRARELYGRLAEGTIQPNVEVAHALFNLGRLAEEDGDTQLALEYYNRLVDEHGDSNWTNLGRNRIIWLTSQGAGAEG